MTLVDALAAALHERYEPIEGGSTGILYDEKYGYNGRCRACGEDGVWSKSIDAAAILADPTFREALTGGIAVALMECESGSDDDQSEYPGVMIAMPPSAAAAAIVARLLPGAVEEALNG